MNIVINWQNLQKRIINWQEVQKVIRNGVQIRPESTPTPWDWLCFTATTNNANGYMWLYKEYNPTSVSLEISTNWTTRSDYTINNLQNMVHIPLTNIWDKVYFRNKSSVVTGFSDGYNLYKFSFSVPVNASWDIGYLLCNSSTTTITSNGCFSALFSGQSNLLTAPRLPATTISENCYDGMFMWCTSLTTPPELPAVTWGNSCYIEMFNWCTSLSSIPFIHLNKLYMSSCAYMFDGCSLIKVSETQTWEYVNPYYIIITESGSQLDAYDIFVWTGGTFTWDLFVFNTYYTSNPVV